MWEIAKKNMLGKGRTLGKNFEGDRTNKMNGNNKVSSSPVE